MQLTLLYRESSSVSGHPHGSNVVNGGNSNSNSTNPTAGWLVERASPSQVCSLNKLVEEFCERCHQISGRQSTALRSAFKMQVMLWGLNFLYYIEF